MRCLLASLVLLVVVPGFLRGQVDVELVLDRRQFLADESLVVGVRVVNRSGQLLVLGKEPGWLEFTVESREGVLVPKRADPPVMGEFTVKSSASATKEIDLIPYYKLSTPGQYRVTATVRIAEWDKVVVSVPADIDIGRGTTIWEQEFGVPQAEGLPEVRKYALQQVSYLKRPMLYLRLSDARELRIFRVLPLGPLVSFSHPEQVIDQQSRLHVLFQVGARSFNYSVVDPDGQVVKRQSYQYFQSRPSLRSKEGEVVVVGGARRARADDLPPPEAEPKTDDESPPKP